MGKMLRDGSGTAPDPVAALRWFRLAAEQGYAKAQDKLGARYAEGAEGLPADPVQALAWTILAARQGHPAAIGREAGLRERMTAEQVAAAERQAAGFSPVVSGR